MIETHTIRLRGPWECDVGGQQTKVRMPAPRETVVPDSYRGLVSCRRRFGCPTCLDAHERVWLVIEQPIQAGEAALNGQPLGAFSSDGPTEFDITDRLRERNELLLTFAYAHLRPEPDDGLLFQDVRLEIRG